MRLELSLRVEADKLHRLLETADQAFIGQIYYHYGISNFSNSLALIEGTQTWYALFGGESPWKNLTQRIISGLLSYVVAYTRKDTLLMTLIAPANTRGM